MIEFIFIYTPVRSSITHFDRSNYDPFLIHPLTTLGFKHAASLRAIFMHPSSSFFTYTRTLQFVILALALSLVYHTRGWSIPALLSTGDCF